MIILFICTRLIRTKKYIEEEDIQKHAMLPNKESKELTYKLMAEHFISVQVRYSECYFEILCQKDV